MHVENIKYCSKACMRVIKIEKSMHWLWWRRGRRTTTTSRKCSGTHLHVVACSTLCLFSCSVHALQMSFISLPISGGGEKRRRRKISTTKLGTCRNFVRFRFRRKGKLSLLEFNKEKNAWNEIHLHHGLGSNWWKIECQGVTLVSAFSNCMQPYDGMFISCSLPLFFVYIFFRQ